MKVNLNLFKKIALLHISILSIGLASQGFSMGLRTFVALPVEKGGGVVRFQFVKDGDIDKLISGVAYGISAKQTLLLGLPYRLSPSGKNRQGDVSILYRQIVIQNDNPSGTSRLGLLGGAIIATDSERDPALQAGFVYTHFKGKNEIDADLIYQSGLDNRLNSGRYDLSWQHRLIPKIRPDWGITKELNSVLELNGRWKEGNNTTHQLTVGLQQVHKKWVLEGGITKDINKNNDVSYLLSTRFHF